MSLRSPLLALLAGLLLVPLASAQSLRLAGQALGTVTELAPEAASGLDAPANYAPTQPFDASRAVAPCTGSVVVEQPFVTGATFLVDVGDPIVGSEPPVSQELGQTFIVPCDGVLSAFSIVADASVAGQSVTFQATFFDGAGTTGTVLRTRTATYTLPSVGGFLIPLDPSPFLVTQGQTLTAFIDILSTSASLTQRIVDPGTYAGGTALLSTTGDAADAEILTGIDINFSATFSPPTTATAGPFFNPTSSQGDGAGWRLLSSPVSGVTITALAQQNLVQGVAAGANPAADPAQYPEVASNLLVTYAAPTGYFDGGDVGGTDFTPSRGTGYFWYFYDQDIDPGISSGTSQSVELSGFTLSATGAAASGNVTTSYYGLASSDGEYLLGNPFARPYRLSGVSGGGTVGSVFQVWDPAAGAGSGSFVLLGPTDYVAPWQGFFATATQTTGTLSFVHAFAATDPSQNPTFYGRSGAADEAAVRFRLDGETAVGPTVDLAAMVRFLDDAAVGPDLHDGGKILPPGSPYALVAPVDASGDAPRYLAVNSLPATGEAVTVPLAFQTTAAGTFTLSWENTLEAGRTAILRDVVTGAETDLAAATEYTFEAEAGDDWTDRFELVTSVVVSAEDEPSEALLSAVAPNPATETAALTLRVATQQAVRATLVDALGREVAVLFDGDITPSAGTVLTVDAASLAPGVYVVRVEGTSFVETRRLTVVR